MTLRELYYKFAGHFNSKVFTAMLKSFLVVLSLPILINLLVAGISLSTIERETIRFADNILKKTEDELDRASVEAHQLINFVKKNEIILNYSKANNRNPWTEFQISRLLSNIVPTYTTIETAYLYYPENDYVLSAAVGGESKFFAKYHYGTSFEEWKEMMNAGWTGNKGILKGKDKSIKNLMVRSVLGGEKYQNKAIIAVQFDSSRINQILDNYKLNPQDKLAVFWGNQIIYSSPSYPLTLDEQVMLYHTQNGESISFPDNKYHVITREQNSSGLKIFYLQNKSQGNYLLLFNRFFVIFAVGGYVLVSFILSFFITKYNYTPIQKVFSLFQEEVPEKLAEDYETIENNIKNYISKHNHMSSKLKEYENDLKVIYLEKLLHGKVIKEVSIREGAKLYHLQFTSGYCILILFQIKEEEKSSIEDINIRELLYELSVEFFTSFNELYLLEENAGYAALINADAKEPDALYYKTKEESHAFQNYLDTAENLSIEISISKTFENLNQLHQVYQQMCQQKHNQEDNALMKGEEQEKQCSIERIIEIIIQDIEDCNLSTALVAQQLNITQSYLSRYFKQQMGFGVLDYIHKYRIDMAKKLMKENHNIRIKEVAERTGFFNVSSFIRVFKKSEGITPGEFRNSLL